ncbi:MAG: hypothetical protein E7241_04045 [Lachnospiraceae bacterium]|jgi:flagellar hook-length control protein FliK|nr:hypothetical protein [Lachnospiraceae bacterium]
MADLMVKGINLKTMEGMTVNTGKEANKECADPIFASLLCKSGSMALTENAQSLNLSKTQTSPDNPELTSKTFKDKIVKDAPKDDLSTKLDDKSVETLSMYNDKIKEAVMDEYGISEEELEMAMQVLGLDYIQLLIPENLVNLSVEITGATDSLELLSNASFNELFGKMQEIMGDISQEFPITPETVELFADTLAAKVEQDVVPTTSETEEETLNLVGEEADTTNVGLEQKEGNTTPAQAVEQLVTQGIEKGTIEVTVVESPETEENVPAKETVQMAGTKEPAEAKVPEEHISVNGDKGADIEEPIQTQLKNELGAETESKNETGSKTETKETAKTDKTFEKTESNIAPMDSKNSFKDMAIETPRPAVNVSQVDTFDIIRQINNYMRLNIQGTATSLEMQLNPENLGKLALNVSVKDGMVTAQIAVQNEAVRQALESQMLILRDNMNNQGLKVSAVEVTIASHEFEQNLENGFTGQEQPQSDSRQTGGRRNILASDLNASMEDLEEGDRIAAEIMVQNGNSMDVTA